MGGFKIGSECCNNCVHWDCGPRDDKHGAGKVFTPKSCAKCTSARSPRKGLNTLHTYVCQYFAHIWGISKTFPIEQTAATGNMTASFMVENEPWKAYVSAAMEDVSVRQKTNAATSVSNEDGCVCGGRAIDNAQPSNGIEEVENFDGNEEAELSRRMAEVARANSRCGELLSAGLDPRNAKKDLAVEFMHLLDKAKSGDAKSQFVLARSFEKGDNGAIAWADAHRSGLGTCISHWLSESARNGCAEAAYLLGCYCRDEKYNCWCGDDHLDAYRWLKRAVALGLKDAVQDFNLVKQRIQGNAAELMANVVDCLDENALEKIGPILKNASAQMGECPGDFDHGVIRLYQVEPELVDDVIFSLEKKASECDREGLIKYLLGCMYCHVSGYDRIVSEDYDRGYEWFEAAEAEGNGDAKEYLSNSERANLYAKSMALEKLKDATDANIVLNAGWRLYQMPGVGPKVWGSSPKNEDAIRKAFTCFTRAYELAGDSVKAAAAFALARCYYFHDGVAEDEEKALTLFEEAAEKWFEDAAAGYSDEYGDSCKYIAAIYEYRDWHVARLGWLKCAAACGDDDAMEELGIGYLEGDCWEGNYEKALYWLQLGEWLWNTDTNWRKRRVGDSPLTKAKSRCRKSVENVMGSLFEQQETLRSAANGDAEALCCVGNWLKDGEYGVKQDACAALSWFYRAARKGFADAQYRIGYAYYFGNGVVENKLTAFGWFEKAAKQGHAKAQCRYAECYLMGNGVAKDLEKAREWYTKSAEQGDALARFNLGKIYYFGNGVSKDYAKAAEWFAKAAEDGRVDAQLFLGTCYRRGLGVEKNLDKAFELYTKAAGRKGEAKFWLGKFYEKGWGSVDKDARTAYGWFLKAAEDGYVDAICAVGWAYQLGDGVAQDLAKAVEWFGKGAAKDDGVCMNNLARLIEDGKGVEKDLKKALDLFIKASQHGCVRAFYHLGRFYENGLGVGIDLQKAKECYGKAAENDDADAKAALERLNAGD